VNIDEQTLLAEYERASRDWPFIDEVERDHDLPAMLLYAVGSRETNLTNEVGDLGHGHGVWQLDDRSHTIPPGFDQDVKQQAQTAAGMLAGLLRHFADQPEQLRCALAAYNAGEGTVEFNLANGLDIDKGTAHGDYSVDTADRMHHLQEHAMPLTDDDIDRIRRAVLGAPITVSPLAEGDQHSLAALAAQIPMLLSRTADIEKRLAKIMQHDGI
jgi:hypothetical protein